MKIPHKAVAVFRVWMEHKRHWETGKALRVRHIAARSVRILVQPSAAYGGSIRLCGSPEFGMKALMCPEGGASEYGFPVSPPSASLSRTVFSFAVPRAVQFNVSLSRRLPPPQAAAFICKTPVSAFKRIPEFYLSLYYAAFSRGHGLVYCRREVNRTLLFSANSWMGLPPAPYSRTVSDAMPSM